MQTKGSIVVMYGFYPQTSGNSTKRMAKHFKAHGGEYLPLLELVVIFISTNIIIALNISSRYEHLLTKYKLSVSYHFYRLPFAGTALICHSV